MNVTKLTSKGQVVIPLKIRELMGWKKGQYLWVSSYRGNVLLRTAKP